MRAAIDHVFSSLYARAPAKMKRFLHYSAHFVHQKTLDKREGKKLLLQPPIIFAPLSRAIDFFRKHFGLVMAHQYKKEFSVRLSALFKNRGIYCWSLLTLYLCEGECGRTMRMWYLNEKQCLQMWFNLTTPLLQAEVKNACLLLRERSTDLHANNFLF